MNVNYDKLIKEYAEDYIKYLLYEEGMTYEEFKVDLGKSFPSRVNFFKNVRNVKLVREEVLEAIIMQLYMDKLTPVEEKFLEQYDAIRETLNCSDYDLKKFFENWQNWSTYRWMYRHDCNRVSHFVCYRKGDESITKAIKSSQSYQEIEERFLSEAKREASKVIGEVLRKVSEDKEFWVKTEKYYEKYYGKRDV